MATTAVEVKLVVPAEYLEDVRTALVAEIRSDSGMLKTNQASMVESASAARVGISASYAEDRDGAVTILRQDLGMLERLIGEREDVELVANPDALFHVLEALARVLKGQLDDACDYSPVDLGWVERIAERLAWAAVESRRLFPEAA